MEEVLELSPKFAMNEKRIARMAMVSATPLVERIFRFLRNFRERLACEWVLVIHRLRRFNCESDKPHLHCYSSNRGYLIPEPVLK